MAASKGSSAKRTGAKKTASGHKTTGGRKGGSGSKKQGSSVVFADEILFLVALAVSLILLFSNLHLCGSVGDVLHAAMRGMMGTLGYVFPFFLFGVTVFLISNRQNLGAVLKLLAVVLAFWLLCGILQLFCSEVPDYMWELADWYETGQTMFSGGVLGGILYALLRPALGLWGMAVVLAVGLILLTVLITGRSFFQPVRRGSSRIYSTARADVRRKKESYDEYRSQVRERKRQEREAQEQAEQEEKQRMEQRRRELLRNTQTGPSGSAAATPSYSDGAALQESVLTDRNGTYTAGMESPDRPEPLFGGETSRRPEPLYQTDVPHQPEALYGAQTPDRPEPLYGAETLYQTDMPHQTDGAETAVGTEQKPPEPLYGEENEADWLSSMSGEIDRIFVRQDIRTLDELNAVEQPEGTNPPDGPMFVQDSEMTDWVQSGEADPDWQSAGTDGAFPAEDAGGDARFSFKKSAAQVDTRTVTTAAGKVIEVEVKPEDLIDQVSRPVGFSAKSGLPEQVETGSDMVGDTADVLFSEMTGKTADAAPEGPAASKKAPGLTVIPGHGAAGGNQIGNGGRATGGFGTGPDRQAASGPTPVPRRPRPYTAPPVNLLKPVSGQNGRNRDFELKETAVKLQQTLKSFGVGVSVTNISCGPSVTRYEITPEQGVKVSKIVSLTDDIKLNLAAADIRIEAPIPGKSAVGIEVPNKEKVTVFFREMIESPEFQNHPSKLAFAVGKDLAGRIIVTDLAGMPHLLIAGATGSGKSVCINTLIMSLLYKAKPDEVKLIMVDPKVVELSVYNGIPHLLIPVVTDPKKAAGALNWAVAEMTDRYNKFAEYAVRDLKSYNAKIKRMGTDENGEPPHLLPQIVIIVDELADLMMVAPGEVEDAICRLAQLARAAGIHLVLATQRPSVNVITGLIKANMPSRIAFAVSSGVDSRTILDMNGAEKLLGKGDMLFSPSGYPKPVRMQGAFVSDTEVSDVVKFIADNDGGPAYQSAIDMQLSADRGMLDGRGGASERDPYFAQAGLFVIEKEKASSGMLQRAFKIGFNRAARIVDQLAEAGVVGTEEGTKPRKILMTKSEFETYLQENQIQ